MSYACVNCKKTFTGRAHDSESWIGEWCSAECKLATDKVRGLVCEEEEDDA